MRQVALGPGARRGPAGQRRLLPRSLRPGEDQEDCASEPLGACAAVGKAEPRPRAATGRPQEQPGGWKDRGGSQILEGQRQGAVVTRPGVLSWFWPQAPGEETLRGRG